MLTAPSSFHPPILPLADIIAEEAPTSPGIVLDTDTLRNSLREMNLGGAVSSKAVENRMKNAREEHRKSVGAGGREDEAEDEISAARHSLKKVG